MKKIPPQSSSKNSHSKSTIIEALCELHFTSSHTSSDEAWDGKWFGRLLTELGKGYDMEPKLVSGVQVQSLGGQTKLSSQTFPIAHMIYRCKNDSHLIQLSPWKLTINELKYENWAIFLEHIQHAWICLYKIVELMGLTRIGMRYINKIPLTSTDESVGSWISDTGLVPKSILEQKKNFFYRNEFQKTDDLKLILTIAEEKSNAPSALIFDIDLVSIKEFNPEWSSIASEVTSIHDEIRKIFDDSRTDRYTKFLNNSH